MNNTPQSPSQEEKCTLDVCREHEGMMCNQCKKDFATPSQNWEDSNKNWRVEVRRLISRCHASVYEDEMKKSQAEMLEHIDNLLTSREELLKQRCLEEIEDMIATSDYNNYDSKMRALKEAVTRVFGDE